MDHYKSRLLQLRVRAVECLRDAGFSRSEVARLFGQSRELFTNWLIRHDIYFPVAEYHEHRRDRLGRRSGADRKYDWAAVATDWNAGMSVRQIMKKHGIKRWSSLESICEAMDLPKRRKRKALKRLTQAERIEALRRVRTGRTQEEVAKEMGVSQSTISLLVVRGR